MVGFRFRLLFRVVLGTGVSGIPASEHDGGYYDDTIFLVLARLF